MWARDFLIIDGILYPGERIRDFRCISAIHPIPGNSNAVLIQLQGMEKYGVLQKITTIRCFRGAVSNEVLQINIASIACALNNCEFTAINKLIAQEYPKALMALNHKLPASRTQLSGFDSPDWQGEEDEEEV